MQTSESVPMKKYYLAVQKESLQKAIYALTGPTTIGRGPDSSIWIQDPTSSRNHARVSFQQGGWVVEDLGSANGIILNGKRVERIPLQPGDVLQIGGVHLHFMEKEVLKTKDSLFDTLEDLLVSVRDEMLPCNDYQGEAWSQRIIEAIVAIPFFSQLEQTERKQLADAATLHVFGAGEVILREGDPGRSIYAILDGRVKVFTRDYQGKDMELAVLVGSQFFGEMSFLSGNPRSSWVAALDTTVVLELNYTSMRQLMDKKPAVKELLLKYYSERSGITRKKRIEAGIDDRRGHPRLRERLTVNLVTSAQAAPDGKVKRTSWQVFSVDISVSGIVVGVPGTEPDMFQLHDQVRLTIEFPAGQGEILARGIVRRLQPARTEKKMVLMGIEFVDMAATETEKLKKLIHGESHLGP
jgi:pSer/pThr/pTyr-binding forkhead associated (FHA) protein